CVLNSDHLVVCGKNIFSPKPELVMLVGGIVPVRFVMRFNRSGSVHFRKLRLNIHTHRPFAKSEIRDCGEKVPDGLLLVLCEISLCKVSRSHVPSSISTWIASTLRSKCAIAPRCGANPWAWAALVIGAAC